MTDLATPSAVVSQLSSATAIVTSHSIDGTFEYCERKFEFAHIWSQQPEGGTSGFAAEVGTALHEAVQAWARIALLPGRDHRSHINNEEAIREGLFALCEWWPWALERISLKEGKAGVKQRSLGEAVLLFERIINAEFWANWELLSIDGFGLSIEVPWRITHASFGLFPLPMGGQGYMARQGKMDFVLRNIRSGEIRVFDLKTTVKDKAAHAAEYKFSGQGSDYAMIIAKALNYDFMTHGLKMSYVVANFASANGEEEAEVNLRTYTYDYNAIQDGIDLKHRRLERMVDNARRGHWPRRTHGCTHYNQACVYFRVCHRRDPDFLKLWFAFEGYFEAKRIYDPIWELIA